jgi:uncharacterized membrane protein
VFVREIRLCGSEGFEETCSHECSREKHESAPTDVKLRIIQFINVFLFALVAGVFWGTWFGLSRSIVSIPPGTFLEIGRTMIANLAWPMRILFPAAILSSLPVLLLLFRQGPATAFYFALTGLLLFIAALLITLLVNVPIDYQIKQWTLTSLPSNWEEVRDRWQFYHTIRTFISLGALGCALASSLFLKGTDGTA